MKDGRNVEVFEKKIADAVMHRIAKRRALRARIGAAAYGTVTIAGIAGLVPMVYYVAGLIQSSGFASYVSLAFSGDALASSWKPLALSILESAPIVESIPALALLVIAVACAKKLVSDINNLRSYNYASA